MTLAVLLLMAVLVGGGWLWTPDRPRQALEDKYAAPPSRFVQVAGLRIHLRETGPPAPPNATNAPNVPVLLLLHGFGSSLHTWEPWALALSEKYRVLRIDLPGAGLTGPDPTGDYSDARGVSLLLALLDQLGVDRATLIGHSMGGRLAWRFAADQPQRVDKLVLVAPDGFASPGFEYGKPPEVGLALRAMPYALPKAMLRMGLQPAYADPKAMTEELSIRYHDMMLAPGVRGALIQRMEQMMLQEPTPFLKRISAPTLLLWGEKDAMIPVANAQDYLKVMPTARLVVLPAIGHLPHEETPAAALPALMDFLAGR